MTVEPGRLIAARTAKGWSQDTLAERAGVSQQTIGKLEKGTARTSKFLPKIAAVLEVPLAELDDSFGEITTASQDGPLHYRPPPVLVSEEHRIPLFASAEGTNDWGSLIITTEAIDYVPRPYTLENVKEAYAILIEGESMVPAFEPGDMAWVNPMLSARRDHDVIIYGMWDQTGETRAVIKRMVSYTDAEWTLKQYNPAEVFTLNRGSWRICHRVVGKLSKR